MNKHMLKKVIVWGLFLIPFLSFLVSSSFFFPFIVTKVLAWRVIVEIIFAAWLILICMAPEYRPKKSPLLYGVFAFIAVIGLADIFGVNPVKSFWSNFERMEGFIALLHLGAFFLVTSVFDEGLWRKWWKTELVASAMMVGFAFLQLLGLATINQGGARVDGTFGNATYLAVYMLVNIFIAGFFLAREWREKSRRPLYIGLIILQFIVLYYTATRGAILGLLAGLLAFAVINLWNKSEQGMRKLSIWFLGALLVVVAGFFLVRDTSFVRQSPVLNRFATLNATELKGQGRYFVWPMAWEGFKERPLLGWGQDNFMAVFQSHYTPEMYKLEPWFDRAHNIFLDWLIAGGLLGLLAYLSLYAAALYLIWRRGQFSFTERAVLTSLLVAYFFHSLFVFDHLASYILFFSLLSYLHFRSATEPLWKGEAVSEGGRNVVLGGVVLLLLATLYFVTWKPLQANSALLNALGSLQVSKDYSAAAGYFEKAYRSSTLGQVEVVEQSISHAVEILQSGIPLEEKNAFFAFVKGAIEEKDKRWGNDTRFQLTAGSFFSSVGSLDEALARLNKAKELTPGKPEIYFELGSAYINGKEPQKALAVFKQAYEMVPEYQEARVIYLIGAIYAKEIRVEAEMRALLDERTFNFDDRIMGAYYVNGRVAEVRTILNERKRLDPGNAAAYDQYLNSL